MYWFDFVEFDVGVEVCFVVGYEVGDVVCILCFGGIMIEVELDFVVVF